MDDNSSGAPKNRMRLSHKIGLSLLSGGAIFSLTQLNVAKEYFTGEVTRSVVRIELNEDKYHKEIMDALRDHIKDDSEKRIRVVDTLRKEIASSESRCEEKNKDLKTDVRDLQIYAFKFGFYKKSQN